MKKILVVGALGQVGSELSVYLQKIYGQQVVLLADLREPDGDKGQFEKLDVLDYQQVERLITEHKITEVYHLAAILSATGEKNPLWAWDVNMRGLLNVLEAAQKHGVEKVFWPSTIAVFGSHIPTQDTPQHVPLYPSTVYGISKAAGELWCQYFFDKYGLDVRSLRYPGLISYVAPPGGGTTDYAVEIYYKALEGQKFDCFLSENTYLPMLYMPDAIRATVQLMQAPKEAIKIRTSYNLGGLSFSPKEIFQAIKRYVPDFEIAYSPDFRQQIADSWPQSIDDSAAKQDWGWSAEYDLDAMTKDMLDNLRKKIAVS